jgi:predicted porin
VALNRHIAVGVVVASLAAAAAAVPAVGSADNNVRFPRKAPVMPRSAGSFTPSAADPKLAALFARGGLDSSGFRFTPSEARNTNRSITVAVRARSATAVNRDSTRFAAAAPTVGVAPIAYNLGVAVGWKRFAVSGDLAKVDLGVVPGSREAADVALSYSGNKWTGRLSASTDRALPGTVRTLAEPQSYSLDVGGSYSITRNIDLTAGMRLKSERDRLTRIDDDRRDSQAVYVGTAFRF